MRKLLLALLALALVPAASAALADDVDFTETYYARIAVGDIPSTNATEADGQVNAVEYLRFQHDTETLIAFDGVADAYDCTCGALSVQDNVVRVDDTVPAGEYVLAVMHHAPAGDAWSLGLGLLGSETDAQVVVYTTPGMQVTAPVDAVVLPGSTGPWDIHSFTGVPADFWFTAHPAVTAPEVPVTPSKDGFDYLALGLGVLAGAIVWAVLVQKGYVQARSRKQVVSTAAHAEAAKEGKAVLEGRKRLLMASLKELEMAKMQKEVDEATYDKLKAEFKKHAVTVMRAIEENV